MMKRQLVLFIAAALIAGQWARLAQSAPIVGAYYYPWYGFPGGHGWNETLRQHLTPPQPPAIGYYDSRANATIAAHIDHSHQGNIDFWAMSWWGPTSAEETTIRTKILAHPRAAELKYAIHYESTGRLGSFDNPNFSNLVPDFQYLTQNYFSNANYFRIDGRPVVFIYLTRAYFNTQAGRDAVANLRQTMNSQFGVDPYLVGDDVFPGQNNAQRAALWDAITDFDVYGSALQSSGSTTTAVNSLASQFQSARQLANSVQRGFIPAVSPGFNDRAVRSGHPAAPRYLTDVPGSTEGSLFSSILNQAVLPSLDSAGHNILMVSTFNEWHEDTQIEPTIVANATSSDNGAGSYTQGFSYSGYGNLYLDLLRAATALAGDFNRDGTVDAADYVIWRDTLSQAVMPFSGADGDGDGSVDNDDYNVWRANFGATAGSLAGVPANAAAPEPAAKMLLVLGATSGYGWRRRSTWQAPAAQSPVRRVVEKPILWP
jgi:glycoprotein endo-alpha-1,2-mannosidase